MFGIDSSELLLVAIVALVVIGPKDLPKALRVVGYWVGKARGVARQFRQGFDSMVREAELEEMEKRWAAENARIMAEHPAPAADDAASPDTTAAEPTAKPSWSDENAQAPLPLDPPATAEKPVAAPADAVATDNMAEPVMVEKPVVAPADTDRPAPRPDGAPS